MSKHIAVYVRVSTKQQSTKSQEPDLKQWLADDANTNGLPYKLYKDSGVSGKRMDGKGWTRMIEAMRQGKVSTIIAWRLDRLGRSAKGLTALFAELNERKVNLVLLKDKIDLSTPSGRLMAHVVASMAEYETEMRAERVLAGQAVARKAGKTWGGSKPGVRKVVTEEQVESIKHLHEKETPIARIAKAVGLSRPTIYAVLNE